MQEQKAQGIWRQPKKIGGRLKRLKVTFRWLQIQRTEDRARVKYPFRSWRPTNLYFLTLLSRSTVRTKRVKRFFLFRAEKKETAMSWMGLWQKKRLLANPLKMLSRFPKKNLQQKTASRLIWSGKKWRKKQSRNRIKARIWATKKTQTTRKIYSAKSTSISGWFSTICTSKVAKVMARFGIQNWRASVGKSFESDSRARRPVVACNYGLE